MFKKLCFSVCLCAMAVGTLNADDSSLLQEIYTQSALKSQLDSIPSHLHDGFRSQGAGIDSKTRQFRKNIAQELSFAYSPAQFKNHILYSLERLLNDDDKAYVLAWLESPLGKKVTQLNVAYTSKDLRPDSLIALNPSADSSNKIRHTLITTLDQALMATESALSVEIYLQAAIAFAATATDANAGAHHYEDFLGVVANQREKMAPGYRQSTQTQLSDIHQNLSDNELRQLIAFAMSPAGTRYTAGIQTGIKSAFTDGSRALDKQLAALDGAGSN